MPHTPETSSSILEQLSEIQDEAKKNKVQLTPEVEAYIREHLEAVQQKLANREEVTEDDMQFMQDVRLWVSLPDNLRQMFPTIEGMSKEISYETIKRHISPKQWLDLLHVASAVGKEKKWIDETFRFPGDGIIVTVDKYFNLAYCSSLISLPNKLRVIGDLDIGYSTSLTTLPHDLEVDGNLYISDELDEKIINAVFRLKDEGKIKGEIEYHENQ